MNMKTAQVPIAKISPSISDMGPKAPGTIRLLACSLKNCGEEVTERTGHFKGQRRILGRFFKNATSAYVRFGQLHNPRLQQRVDWRLLQRWSRG